MGVTGHVANYNKTERKEVVAMAPRGNIPPRGGTPRRGRQEESDLYKLNIGLSAFVDGLFGRGGVLGLLATLVGGQTQDFSQKVQTGPISVTGTAGITNIATIDTLINQIESQGRDNVAKILDYIKQELLKNQDISLGQKQEAMDDIETAAREATKTKPNKNVMKAALERMKGVFQTVTSLTSLVPITQKVIEEISKLM